MAFRACFSELSTVFRRYYCCFALLLVSIDGSLGRKAPGIPPPRITSLTTYSLGDHNDFAPNLFAHELLVLECTAENQTGTLQSIEWQWRGGEITERYEKVPDDLLLGAGYYIIGARASSAIQVAMPNKDEERMIVCYADYGKDVRLSADYRVRNLHDDKDDLFVTAGPSKNQQFSRAFNVFVPEKSATEVEVFINCYLRVYDERDWKQRVGRKKHIIIDNTDNYTVGGRPYLPVQLSMSPVDAEGKSRRPQPLYHITPEELVKAEGVPKGYRRFMWVQRITMNANEPWHFVCSKSKSPDVTRRVAVVRHGPKEVKASIVRRSPDRIDLGCKPEEDELVTEHRVNWKFDRRDSFKKVGNELHADVATLVERPANIRCTIEMVPLIYGEVIAGRKKKERVRRSVQALLAIERAPTTGMTESSKKFTDSPSSHLRPNDIPTKKAETEWPLGVTDSIEFQETALKAVNELRESYERSMASTPPSDSTAATFLTVTFLEEESSATPTSALPDGIEPAPFTAASLKNLSETVIAPPKSDSVQSLFAACLSDKRLAIGDSIGGAVCCLVGLLLGIGLTLGVQQIRADRKKGEPKTPTNVRGMEIRSVGSADVRSPREPLLGGTLTWGTQKTASCSYAYNRANDEIFQDTV